MKLAIAILALGLFTQSDDVRLSKVSINKEISVNLPANFSPLSENEIRQRYNSSKGPIAIYTSSDHKTDFGVNIVPSQWQEDDLIMMKSFYRSSIINLYDSVDFTKEEIQLINKRNFLVFVFMSLVNSDPESVVRQPSISSYHYLQYTLVNGKMVLFTFTAPASQRIKWQDLAEEIMHSVKIKKTL